MRHFQLWQLADWCLPITLVHVVCSCMNKRQQIACFEYFTVLCEPSAPSTSPHSNQQRPYDCVAFKFAFHIRSPAFYGNRCLSPIHSFCVVNGVRVLTFTAVTPCCNANHAAYWLSTPEVQCCTIACDTPFSPSWRNITNKLNQLRIIRCVCECVSARILM